MTARAFAAVLAIAPLLGSLLAVAGPAPARAFVLASPWDFNGDRRPDVAVGAPHEAVGAERGAGEVTVLYTSSTGISAAGAQRWTQATEGVPGRAEGCARRDCEDEGDAFGRVLASADFDRDGFADLAIGVPYDRVGTTDDVGAVNVLYGSRRGLTATGAQRWSQASVGVAGTPAPGDLFGSALAAGDLDGDTYPDLAIGAPGDTRGGLSGAGTVHVLRGSPDGIAATGAAGFGRTATGLPDAAFQAFGTALAIGRFSADGYADLVVGDPDYHCNSSDCVTDGGAAVVLHGGPDGIPGVRVERWTQDAPGVVDMAERDDFLGAALAVGDFDGDGRDDLAVGVPREKVTECGQWCLGQGAVTVVYGAANGLSGLGSQLWHLDSPGIPGDAQPGTYAGRALAAGDLDGDGADELVLGLPLGLDASTGPGAVVVIRGSEGIGLTAAEATRWTQATAGVPGKALERHGFGLAVAVRVVGTSACGDLLVGVPGDDVAGVTGPGSVIVLFGSPAGVTASGAERWSQATDGVPGTPERGDAFGMALGG